MGERKDPFRETNLADGPGLEEDSVRDGNAEGNVKDSRAKTYKLKIKLDPWQEEVLATKGAQNVIIRAGRQVGKSTIISILAGSYAVKNPNKSVMVISHAERQAFLLFSKIRDYILDHYSYAVKNPHTRNITKSEINLKNGTILRCLPTGLDGTGIRGYTVDLLIADEAAHIPDDVFPAVRPMLTTTGGKLILLSTPMGSENFFYKVWADQENDFKRIHINAEDISRYRIEQGDPSGTYMKKDQDEAKRVMTKLVYSQEYLGEFTDNLRQLFPDKLIRDHMKLKRPTSKEGNLALGVDVARMGGDLCTFEIGDFKPNGEIYHVENFITENILIPDTINLIKNFNKDWKDIMKIYIDTGGMGVAIFDFLLKDPDCMTKVVAIDNARRAIERDGWDVKGRRKQLMKEQLYMDMKRLLEQDKLWLLDDESVFFSLKSIQMEWDPDTQKFKIFGTNTHIAEGLIRMCRYDQEKVNKLRFDYI